MARKRKATIRHRLLIYHQLGQRWRTPPLLTALVGALLYALGWLSAQGILQGGNTALLARLWDGRIFLFLLIVTSLILYVFTIMLSRTSYVEARLKALRVRTGFLQLDISYKRIRQIRLVQMGAQYPIDSLKGSERALAMPFASYTCTAVDVSSWPWPGQAALRQLWSKFMFTSDRGSLLFVVQDAILLNQQIDARLLARQMRSKDKAGYLDPVERAAAQAKRKN